MSEKRRAPNAPKVTIRKIGNEYWICVNGHKVSGWMHKSVAIQRARHIRENAGRARM